MAVAMAKQFYGNISMGSVYNEFSSHERSGFGNNWWKDCSFGKLIVITSQILLVLFFVLDATTIQSEPCHPKWTSPSQLCLLTFISKILY